MSGIQGLVPEDPVDGEILLRLEGVGLGQPVQHPGTYRGGMGPTHAVPECTNCTL